MHFERHIRLTAVIGALLAAHSAQSMSADLMPASAPGFCHPMTPAQRAAWQQKMGPLLNDLHHYCYGLRDMHKADKPGISKRERDGHFVSAIEEFDYVLHAKKAQKPHWFLPEVHMKKAFALMKIGRYAESQAEFERARAVEQQAGMAPTGSR